MLYTAQIRYPGNDRLDITVKSGSGTGKLFAPTWNMVMEFKHKDITEEEYTAQYYQLLIDRWNAGSAPEIQKFVELVKALPVTVVCYCKSGDFCHRYLLKEWLVYNFKVDFGGERSF